MLIFDKWNQIITEKRVILFDQFRSKEKDRVLLKKG